MTIDEIVLELISGKVVALPTDGVFGLFALKGNHQAINDIYEMKKRDFNKKMCVYTNDMDFLDVLIYPKRLNNLPKFGMTYIYNNIGYRSGNIHKSLLKIIEKTGDLIGTSCNYSNTIPVTHWSHVPFDVPILKESCVTGIESTIINLDTYELIRSGYTDPTVLDFLNDDGKMKIGNYNITKQEKAEDYPSFESLFGRDYMKYFWYYLNEYKNFDSVIENETYHGKLLNSYLKKLF